MKNGLTLFFLIWSFVLPGQNQSVTTYNFDGSYNLPRKRISSLESDGQGFLWLGTGEGLYRFDGNEAVRVKNLPSRLKNAYITALKIDDQDRLWIGTYSEGLIMLDLKDGTYHQFDISTFSQDNLKHNRVKSINIDASQRVWVGTQISGIQMLRSDHSGFDHFLPSLTFPDKSSREIDDVVCSFYDPLLPEQLWIGTLSGLLRFDMISSKFELYDFVEENQVGKSNFNSMENVPRQVFIYQDSIYTGTWGGGFCVMDIQSKKWRSHKFHELSPVSRGRNVVNIFPYHFDQTKIILCDLSGGSYLYDMTKSHWTDLSDDQYIKSAVDDDRQWLVSRYDGLQVMEMKNQALFVDQLPYLINGFYHDTLRQRYIMAFQSDLSIYEVSYAGEIIQKIDFSPESREGYSFIAGTFLPYQQGFLFKVNKAVLYYDTLQRKIDVLDAFEREFLERPSIMTYDLVGDTLWLGGKGLGLYRYILGQQTEEIFHTKNRGTHDDWIYQVFADQSGNVWYGTDRGFGVYFAKRDTFVAYDRKKSQRDQNAFHGIEVVGFSQDDRGDIFVAGLKGQILQIKNDDVKGLSLKATIVKNENEKGHVFIKMIDDGAGKLWVNSYSLIFSYDIKTGVIEEYVLPDRLLNNWGVYSLQDGRIGMALANGFSICRANPSYTTSSDFALIYTGLSLMGNEKYSGYQLEKMNHVELDYNENYITVETALLGITDPDYIEYEYKMDGLRDEWVSSPTGNNMYWADLNEGDYTLTIRAGVEGNWIESKPLSIHIAPPFYRTLWFQLLVLGLISGLIYSLYLYRIKQTRIKAQHEIELADMEMKTLRSQMNPHFIFNCLNSIKLAIFEGEIEKAGRYITRFSKLLRTILHHAKSHYVTLEEELKAMTLYIELEKMRFEDKFNYQIDIDPSLQSSQIQIPPMILQPFIENAIWHGLMPKKEKGNVLIQVVSQDEHIQCVIEDDGIGRKAASDISRGRKRHQSLGIQITKERLDILNETYQMNASIDIIDLSERGHPSGTRVLINLPKQHIEETG